MNVIHCTILYRKVYTVYGVNIFIQYFPSGRQLLQVYFSNFDQTFLQMLFLFKGKYLENTKNILELYRIYWTCLHHYI
jgi:hypothetical protein